MRHQATWYRLRYRTKAQGLQYFSILEPINHENKSLLGSPSFYFPLFSARALMKHVRPILWAIFHDAENGTKVIRKYMSLSNGIRALF